MTASGDGTYTFQDSCSTVTVTGSGSIYSGQEDAYDDRNLSACQQIGYVTVTFTLDAGGQQMTEVMTLPAGETGSNGNPLRCDSCGTFTLTRMSS
jgi:hypothetical protein